MKTILMNNLTLVLICLMFSKLSSSQVGVNDNGASPHASAGLDVNFNNKGFLPPRLTSAERDAIPLPIAEGLTIYNSTTRCIETYITSVWQAIGCGCAGAPSSPGSGVHVASGSQITWNWSVVNSASGYRYGTSNDYNNSVDAGNSNSYMQSGVSCGGPVQTLFVWAYNACGHSDPVELSATPAAPPSVAAIAGTTILNAGSTTQLSSVTVGGTWSSSDTGLATVNGSGLVSGVMTGTPTITYTVQQNGCSASTSQVITVVWVCGTPLPRTHIAGTLAPVSKTVNYGTVITSLSGASKCWITQNLGANNQAGSATDATEASSGWYWQFNRKQGYKHDGVAVTPSWTINSISEGANWSAANDPCTIELGSGWRIPTSAEWINVDANGAWTTYNDSYNSVLRIHAAGDIDFNGVSTDRGVVGLYWGSNSSNNTEGKFIWIRSNGCSAGHDGGKAWGFTLRCIKD